MPWLLEGHLGIGTPVGSLGGMFAYDLVPAFSVVAGVGAGLAGPQVATGLRARVPLGSVALGAEVTWSGGPYEWKSCHAFCLGGSDVNAWDFAHWLNLSPAIELRSQRGTSVRLYAGYAHLLNPGAGVCSSYYSSCGTDEELGFFGVAVGEAW